jgi:hypothetical protein
MLLMITLAESVTVTMQVRPRLKRRKVGSGGRQALGGRPEAHDDAQVLHRHCVHECASRIANCEFYGYIHIYMQEAQTLTHTLPHNAGAAHRAQSCGASTLLQSFSQRCSKEPWCVCNCHQEGETPLF